MIAFYKLSVGKYYKMCPCRRSDMISTAEHETAKSFIRYNLYKYENRKLPSYFNGMFVLQHDNVVIRPRRINRTPQRFHITEEILPYNNVCNFKIKHTNSKFCRLCIRYKIPELIKDNYFPKNFLEKMYTHSYSGFTKYAKTYMYY